MVGGVFLKIVILAKIFVKNEQFDRYLAKMNCTPNSGYVTVKFQNSFDIPQNDIFDSFVKKIQHPRIINCDNFEKITDLFIFIQNFDTAVVPTQNTQTRIHIIVCTPVKNFDVPIWGKNPNLVLVFWQERLKIMTYDPYRDIFIDSFDSTCLKLFSDRLKNVKKNVIKVTMCENPPQIWKVGNTWHGKDFELLKLVIFAFNATLEIIETECHENFDSIVKILENGNAEFSFMGLIQDFSQLKSLNTHIFDGIVVLIPQKFGHVLTFLTIFDTQIWIFLTILTGILLNLRRFCSKQSFKIVSLTISTIFLTIFQSKMSSVLTKMTSLNPDLDLYTIPYLYKILQVYQPMTQIKIVNKTVLYEMIQAGHDDKAFIVSYHVALEFLKLQQNGAPIYRILDDFLVPSHRVFLFHKNSPLLNEVRNVVLQLKQTGFLHRLYFAGEKKKNTPKIGFLKLRHLRSVFGILIMGYFSGFVCLLYEILLKKLNKN